MSKPVIRVEGLSKRYKIGTIGTGTLSQDLNLLWKRYATKKEISVSPAEDIGVHERGRNNYIWSLRDVSFEVNEGDIFGVIGKNGAGKSTLLKLLAKITKPTTGRICLGGRIASLLEVGTGFHPDLTGRENIFLNGAILGMKKNEIDRNLDEIVDFSGVGQFIDTPVKRYSSGMYVRLAFAVAAHLDPDILIIDEVLAVGDAEFQQKCIRKIKDIATNKGRTILFVSHNITAVKQLTNRVLVLEKGIQKYTGTVDEGVKLYAGKQEDTESGERVDFPDNQPAWFTGWFVEGEGSGGKTSCFSGKEVNLCFSLTVIQPVKNCEIRLMIFAPEAVLVCLSSLDHTGAMLNLEPGHYQMRFKVSLPLKPDQYTLEPAIISFGQKMDAWMSATPLTVLDSFESRTEGALLSIPNSFYIETAREKNENSRLQASE